MSAAQHNDSGNAEQDLERLVEDWATAELRGDSVFVERLLAEDFTGIGPRGFILTRGEWLQRITSGALKYEQLAWDEVKVRVYGDTGDTAIVTGRQKQRATYQDQPVPGEFRATLVFVRQRGRWLLAGLQLSPIVGPLAGPPSGSGSPAARS